MRNILLAEDDMGTNLMVSKVLQSNGLNVFSTFNGNEAIQILQTTKIDLVITDIMMPLVDGVELLEFIRSSVDIKDIPVIGFSAGNKEMILARLMGIEFDWFFEKPVNLKVLAEKSLELL